MLRTNLMIGALLATTGLSAPVWAHGDDFGVGALVGLGVGAVLGSGGGVVVGAPVYAAPPPAVIYEPQPVYVVPQDRYRTYYYDDDGDHWRARHWRARHRHWDHDHRDDDD